jgi:hypothetical protein
VVSATTNTKEAAPRIFEMEAHRHQDPSKLIFTCPTEKHLRDCHLVEYGSEILVVAHDDIRQTHITVYRLADLVSGKFTPVTNIGENAIFMGPRSICVSSRAFPMIKANTIVYFHPQKGYFEQYNISRRTCSPVMDECSINGLAQGPRSIISHILTCCSNRHWYVSRYRLLFMHNSKHIDILYTWLTIIAFSIIIGTKEKITHIIKQEVHHLSGR